MKIKFNLPISIILGCIILGGFIFATQVIKQESIERQQQAELWQKQTELKTKTEQDKRDYITKKKQDCYDLETSERKKFNNVDGSFYKEEEDVCVVRYVNKNWREGDPIFGVWDETLKIFVGEKKYFTNEF